jgi:choline dehydrogenase-like flavoprotein
MGDDRCVVVVGTGPTGAAAAWALHRAGIPVTVLEAGSRSSARGLTVRAPGMTMLRQRRQLPPPSPPGAPANGAQAHWMYELSAGGLSNHWTCAVPRFAPEDFSEGASLDERYRWPIGYQDLVEHYPDMERILHIGGGGADVQHLPGGVVSRRVPLAPDWGPIVEQARARGHGLTSLPLAYGADWTFTRSGTPFNSFVRMLEPIPASRQFRIVFGAHALRLEWSGERRRATRLIYRDAASGEERAIAADAFVLAAGALGSTRLLMESRSADFPAGLGNTDGVLGRYLHDHPLGKIAVHLGRPLSIHPPVYLTRGPYDEASRLRGVATILWSGTGLRLRSWSTLTPGRSTHIGFNLFGMFPPDERSGVTLATRREPSGAAALDVHLRFDEPIRRTLERGRERLLEILDAAGFRPSTKLWLVEAPGTSVHFGGTARMHASPRYGMLDAWNRLHAVPNVLVVDAAAFTTGPEKNPTLTAMAIAARACQRLAADLRSSTGAQRSLAATLA